MFPDEVRYRRIALSLVQGKGYDSAFTAPVYPLFLTGVYSVFGDSHLVVRIVQAIIGTISVLIIYLLGKIIFSVGVGLTAASLSAVYPLFIFFTGLLLTETLFILLFLCLIYLLQKMLLERKTSYAVLSGILSGVCILIKPVLTYFLPLFFLILFLVSKDKKRVMGNGFLLFIMIAMVLSPWIGRNYLRFGAFIPLTTGGGMTLYESNNPRATGGPACENIVWTPEMKGMNEIELDGYFKEEAIKFISNHPKRFLNLAVIKFLRFWSLIPNAREYTSLFYRAISLLSYGPVLLLAIFGLIRSRKMWLKLIPLYLPIIFFSLVHLVILGSIRYRLPLDPYLILFASYGIIVLVKRLKGIN